MSEKISPVQRKAIAYSYLKITEAGVHITQRDIAADYGVAQGTISSAVKDGAYQIITQYGINLQMDNMDDIRAKVYEGAPHNPEFVMHVVNYILNRNRRPMIQ